MCVTSGMDFIEPAVALNVYQIVSSLLYAGIIVPLALWHLSASAPGCDIPGLLAARFRAPAWGASRWRALWAASRTAAGTRP